MIVLPLEERAVGHIAYNLRDADRAELEATLWRFDSAALARSAMASCIGFVAATDDGLPVAAVGAVEHWPGVLQFWMFATPLWPRVALGTTRHVLRWMEPACRSTGAHRAHAFSAAQHTEAHRWLELLGASRETTLKAWGRGGEDFVVYTWWRG